MHGEIQVGRLIALQVKSSQLLTDRNLSYTLMCVGPCIFVTEE